MRWVQEIANSYVDQQQQSKERREVIARGERRLEKRKAGKTTPSTIGSLLKEIRHRIKEDRRLRDRPAKFISPVQAREDGKTKPTELRVRV